MFNKKHVVHVAELNYIDAVGTLLGQRSTHHTAKIVELGFKRVKGFGLDYVRGEIDVQMLCESV